MLKSRTSYIDIDKIKVYSCFRNSLPTPDKIGKRYQFFIENGEFDREIIVDENYYLVDGYSTYLVCKMLDIQKVRVLRIVVSDDRIKELEKKLAESERLRAESFQVLGKVVE